MAIHRAAKKKHPLTENAHAESFFVCPQVHARSLPFFLMPAKRQRTTYSKKEKEYAGLGGMDEAKIKRKVAYMNLQVNMQSSLELSKTGKGFDAARSQLAAKMKHNVDTLVGEKNNHMTVEQFKDPNFKKHLDDPDSAPEAQRSTLRAIREEAVQQAESLKSITKRIQKDLGERPGETLGKKFMKWLGKIAGDNTPMLLKMAAMIGAAFYALKFLKDFIQKLMEYFSGCYRNDMKRKEDKNITKLCGGLANQPEESVRTLCSCDKNSATDGDTSLLVACNNNTAVAPTCYNTKADYEANKGSLGNANFTYNYQPPDPLWTLNEMGGVLADLLDGLADLLLGPVGQILLIGAAVVVGLIALGFVAKIMWRNFTAPRGPGGGGGGGGMYYGGGGPPMQGMYPAHPPPPPHAWNWNHGGPPHPPPNRGWGVQQQQQQHPDATAQPQSDGASTKRKRSTQREDEEDERE